MVRTFVGPFLAVLVVVIFTLSMQFLFTYIDELVGKGLGIGVIFEFLGWAACTLIPMAVPLASLLASIMTLGGLGERNELLAMKAAGVSLMRIITPVMLLSVLISVGAFFASNKLVPHAYFKIYNLRQDINDTKDEIKIPTGTFYDGIEGYILRVEERDKETGMMYGLIVYDHTSNYGNTNLTLADSGRIQITPDKQNMIFDLYDGCNYTEDNLMTYRDTTLELNRTRFKEQNLIISLSNYTFNRSSSGDRFSDQVMSRNLAGLKVDRDSLAAEFDSLIVNQYRRYFTNSGLQYIHQLDTARFWTPTKGDFPTDSLLGTLTYFQKKNAIRMAIDNVDGDLEQLDNYEHESSRYIEPIRRIDIESFRKFTLSLACLLFFFIGAPLGAIIRKGGLGTPVIISILFYLIYYIIDIIGKKLAKNGTITPFIGTIISTFVLIPVGFFLTRKSTQDSSLFNMDSYKEFFRNIGRHISKGWHRFANIFTKGGGKIRIVYMGTPEFAVAPLDALLKNNFKVVGVVTVPDKPSGRGLEVNQSAVKKYALEHNLPVLQPEKLKDPAFLEQLKSLKANLFVVVAFRMLPKEVWQMPAYGTFNLHASLLPQYRGAAPINWAIINGERFTGVTTFLIDEQIDTGKVLFQESCPIEPYEDAGALHDKLMEMGANLVVKTVNAIEDHTAKPYVQEIGFSKVLHPAPKLTRELCHIDWNKDAESIGCLVRGLSPVPSAYTSLVKGDQVLHVKIYDAYDAKIEENGLPVGTVTVDKVHLQVKCGKGILRIYSLQIAGKKRMNVSDFLRGFRNPEEWHFE